MPKLRDVIFMVLGGLALAAVGLVILLPSHQFVLAQFTNDGFREIERYRKLGDCETARLSIMDAFKIPSAAGRAFQCIQLHGSQADALMVALEKEAALMTFERSKGLTAK